MRCGIVFRQRGDHLHVGKTVLQVKAANQVPIGFDPIRIVGVTAADKAQQIRFVGLDDILKPIRRIGRIADEFDRLDAGFPALGNRKNQIDAVVRLFDDFRSDGDVIPAGVTIDFGDVAARRTGPWDATACRAAWTVFPRRVARP